MASSPPLIFPKDCYRVGQVARLLGVSTQAIHTRRIRGTISFLRFGKRYLFPKAEINASIQEANTNAHHAPP